MSRSMYISEICENLGLEFCGPDLAIDGLNLCNRESLHKNILTYVTNPDYADSLKNNAAIVGVVIGKQDKEYYTTILAERELFFVLCEDPEKIFYDIHDYLYNKTDFYDKFQFESLIGIGCNIHPTAVIEEGVVIGDNVIIGANSVIRRGTTIKNGCIIGCNSTIGSEGFQILRVGQMNRKIVHCGGVLLEEDSYVGDNTAICNSLFEGYSYVGKNAKIDNLVHVGHNGYVGDNAVVTAGVILCGSSIVDDGAWIGVNSSVLNRVTVGAYSKIGIGSVVTRDVPQESLAYGVPAKAKTL